VTVRLTALVRGRVQGVGFRYWARATARDLGLVGVATNLPDGRVEVIAEGPRPACEELLAALRSDRPPGWVGDVTHAFTDAEGLTGFTVR
jgi:acylphosphatase